MIKQENKYEDGNYLSKKNYFVNTMKSLTITVMTCYKASNHTIKRVNKMRSLNTAVDLWNQS